MVFKYSYILPIITSLWFFLTFATTYTISLLKNDIFPFYSYISDAGTWPPQSCIFGFMLSVGALLEFSIVYIRYRQIRLMLDSGSDFQPHLRKINCTSLILGILSAVGVAIVGAFQETNVLVIHLIGAGAAFGLATVYQCLQTYISFKIYPKFGRKSINFLRLCCSVLCCITGSMAGTFGLLALRKFQGADITKWREEEGGYLMHLISVVAEWILAFTTILFYLLFTGEFRRILISEPAVTELEP